MHLGRNYASSAVVTIIAPVGFFLFRRGKGRPVEITSDGIRASTGGARFRLIPFEAVSLVYTSLMPKGEAFDEVLAIEFSDPSGDGVLVLDPAEGVDTGEAIRQLREALGNRWQDLYVGHKHLSRVRGRI